MGGTVHRAASVLLAALVGMLGVLLAAGPAAAHNSLTGSDPADGARVAQAPTAVQLRFLSRVDPGATKVTVTGPGNLRAEGGPPTFDGPRVAVPFKPGAAGRYTVSYEVASSDGHVIHGAIHFTLATGRTAIVPSGSPSPRPSAPTGPVTASAPTNSPTPSLAVTAATGDDTGPWLWSLAGVLLLGALAGGALLLRRTRRT